MPLLENPGNPLTASLSEALAPFQSFFGATPNYQGPDFPEGFVIQEVLPEGDGEQVILQGLMMPKQPFTFGGKQRLVKEFYPGNSEPAVQVLGGEEDNIKIQGGFKAKKYKLTQEQMRQVPYMMHELVDGIRKRGSLVRISLGEFVRWGFIETVSFNLKTLADVEYEIDFSIIGDKKPDNCKMAGDTVTVPVETNKALINAALAYEATALNPPSDISQSIVGNIQKLVGEVATAVSLVTKFVDTVVATAEDVQKVANRAIGLVRYARAKIASTKRQIGQLSLYFGQANESAAQTWDETRRIAQAKYVFDVGTATSRPAPLITPEMRATMNSKVSAYTSSKDTQEAAKATTKQQSLESSLAEMEKRFRALAATVPRFRHLVRSGDTLQSISMRYYRTAENWKDIYNHNKLTSTLLTVGTVLEIPNL